MSARDHEVEQLRQRVRELEAERAQLLREVREHKTAADVLHGAALTVFERPGCDAQDRKLLGPIINATGPTPEGMELTPPRLEVLGRVAAAGPDGCRLRRRAGAAEVRALDVLREAGLVTERSTRERGKVGPSIFTVTRMGALRAESPLSSDPAVTSPEHVRRTRAGIAAARANGKRLGRPPLELGPEQLRQVEGLSVRAAAKLLGCTHPTFIHARRRQRGS